MKAILIVLLALTPAIHAAHLTSEDYRGFLVGYEGITFTPYQDGGDTSVGIGHNLTAHHQSPRNHYTESEISAFFNADLNDSLTTIHRLCPDFDGFPIDAQFALVGLCWNVGPHGFSKFHNLIWAVNHRMWNMAAVELADSHWFKQVAPSRAMAYYNMLKHIQ